MSWHFSDIYVCSVSAAHNVSAKDKWLAFISTTAETANHEAELEAAFKLIGPVEEKFIYAQDVYHPKPGQPAGDNVSLSPRRPRLPLLDFCDKKLWCYYAFWDDLR